MATVLEHLRVIDLGQDILEAASQCAEQVGKLKFQSRGDYEVCDDKTGLESASDIFVKKFAPWSKVKQSNPILGKLKANLLQNQFGNKPSRLQAFRFNQTAPLPVSKSMLLVPTTIFGTPITSGEVIKVGSYVQLTSDVQPGFYFVFRVQ
jgi:hypothetical protein